MESIKTSSAVRYSVWGFLFIILFNINGICQYRIDSIYSSYIGVREATGKNDGKQVEAFLRSCGLGKGYAWCSCFVKFCLDKAGIKNTINAWSPTAENRKNVIYDKGTMWQTPRKGDVFAIYYTSLKRVGHVGFYDGHINKKTFYTVEGNTNQAGSREGDGVYRKIRSYNQIKSITRWH